MDKLVSIQEAAQILNISPMTLRRWDASGKLAAVRLGSRGDRKYQLSKIKEILANQAAFASNAMTNFLNSGLMFYAYQEEKPCKYKFTLPENPLGPSERVKEKLKELTTLNLSNYPPVSGMNLAKKICQVYDLPEDSVLVGAGAFDLLHLIFIATLEPRNTIVMPEVNFPATEFLAILSNATVIFSPMTEDLDLDYDELEKIIQEKSPRVVSLCNPNNPTGKVLQKEKTLNLVKTYPNSLFIVDEANVEYCHQTFIKETAEYPNLLVVRTFSKGFGLAALRVGYVVGDSKLIYTLYRRQTPFATNTIGLQLAEVALDDLDHINKTREFILSERKRLEEAFNQKRFSYISSDANYLLVNSAPKFSNSTEFVEYLNIKDINVVDGKSFRGLEDSYVRICPRTKSENDFLIKTILEIN